MGPYVDNAYSIAREKLVIVNEWPVVFLSSTLNGPMSIQGRAHANLPTPPPVRAASQAISEPRRWDEKTPRQEATRVKKT